MINDEMLKEIFEDMKKIDDVQGDNKESEILHDQLIAKYKILFHDFEDRTQKKGKRSFDPQFDYCQELLNVKERLSGHILRDTDSKERLLKKRILSDVQKLSDIRDLSKEDLIYIYEELTGYYDSVIYDLGSGLYGYNYEKKFYDSKLDREYLVFNINKLKNKIESFYDRGCMYDFEREREVIDHNRKLNVEMINVPIEDAIKKHISRLEDMTNLSDEQISKSVEKLHAFKDILDSDKSKRGKWSEIKEILAWSLEEGLEVSTMFTSLMKYL